MYSLKINRGRPPSVSLSPSRLKEAGCKCRVPKRVPKIYHRTGRKQSQNKQMQKY